MLAAAGCQTIGKRTPRNQAEHRHVRFDRCQTIGKRTHRNHIRRRHGRSSSCQTMESGPLVTEPPPMTRLSDHRKTENGPLVTPSTGVREPRIVVRPLKSGPLKGLSDHRKAESGYPVTHSCSSRRWPRLSDRRKAAIPCPWHPLRSRKELLSDHRPSESGRPMTSSKVVRPSKSGYLVTTPAATTHHVVGCQTIGKWTPRNLSHSHGDRTERCQTHWKADLS
jgi:hypothetical protein